MKTVLQRSVNVLPGSIRRAIKYMPGVAATQRWLIRQYLEGQTFVHKLNAGPAAGLRFEVTLPQDKAIWAGTYEYEFTSTIVEHVRKGDICYDVGGYRGFMCGAMAMAGASRVFVFEPLSINRMSLARLLELNPALPLSVLPYAISDNDGSGQFKVMPDLSMGRIADNSTSPETTDLEPVTVRKIDSLVQTHEILPAHVVKIDVEGAELAVLKGSLHVVRACRPKIFIEAHSATLERACSELLAPFRYKIRRMERYLRTENSVRHLICLPC
jgi:FkbM family methyltransferase